jgi:membrane protein DedA with SNARE-associated domain
LPLQVATLGSGAVGYDFGAFLAAIVLSRALRFYGLTALVLLFGEPVLHFIVHLSPVLKVVAAMASLAVVVGLYLIL